MYVGICVYISVVAYQLEMLEKNVFSFRCHLFLYKTMYKYMYVCVLYMYACSE